MVEGSVTGDAEFLNGFTFFRMAYVNLMRAFGGVPLHTTPTETPEELNPSRATRDEVYTLIISDLTAGLTPSSPATSAT